VKASNANRAASRIETTKADQVALNEGSVMGRLEISAIGLKVPIVEGYDPESLRAGVGHITGSAQPGGLGNMALAGHRDTFFRPLRNIRRGMKMSVYAKDGRYEYLVDSTTIVKPEDVRVLAIHEKPELTLITCYPFEYVGSAPNRFIVRAHLASVEASERTN
jgi:sortase A